MAFRLLLSQNDPRCTKFRLVRDSPLLADDHDPDDASASVYSTNTVRYNPPHNGVCATTTITRTAPTGDLLQVGLIDWPARPHDPAKLFVGTRNVHMSKSGIYTSPERFTAADGHMYEWQIHAARSQLAPLRMNRTSDVPVSYVATFVQSRSGFWPKRKRTSSLFVPPEGVHILDDIVVTFIYFESKWRDRENARAHSGFSSLT